MAEEKEINGEEISEQEIGEDPSAILDISPEELLELQSGLEQARLEAEEYKENWMRSQADFSNYKKRIEREQVKLFQDAGARVIKRFLEILDDLDRALQNRPAEGEGAEWAGGIELIYRKLLNILENEGVTSMDALGQEFNPNLHEAISQEENPDYESGQIIEVLQNGYLIGERVLRPALVRVAS